MTATLLKIGFIIAFSLSGFLTLHNFFMLFSFISYSPLFFIFYNLILFTIPASRQTFYKIILVWRLLDYMPRISAPDNYNKILKIFIKFWYILILIHIYNAIWSLALLLLNIIQELII